MHTIRVKIKCYNFVFFVRRYEEWLYVKTEHGSKYLQTYYKSFEELFFDLKSVVNKLINFGTCEVIK